MRSTSLRLIGKLWLVGLSSLGCESLLGLAPTELYMDPLPGSSSGAPGKAGGQSFVDQSGRGGDASLPSGSAGRTARGGESSAGRGGGSSGSGGSRSSGQGMQSAGVGAGASANGAGGTSNDGGMRTGNFVGAGEGGVEAGAGGAGEGGVEAGAGGAGPHGGGGGNELGEGGVAGLGQLAKGAIMSQDNRCLSIERTSGTTVTDARVVLRPCGDDPKQSFSRDAESHLWATAFADAFLIAPADGTPAGLSVAAAHEPAPANELWWFDSVQVMNDGGQCLDVWNADFEQAEAELWACHEGYPELWSITAAGQIQQETTTQELYCLDLPYGNDANGSTFQVFPCYAELATNQQYVFDDGRINPLGKIKCLTVDGDPTESGVELVTDACDRSVRRPVAQSFHLRGPIQNQGLCLTMAVDSDSVWLAECARGDAQTWEWYF